MRLRRFILLFIFIPVSIYGQAEKRIYGIFTANTRHTFYSWEKTGEVLVHVPGQFVFSRLNITITQDYDTIGFWNGVPGAGIARIKINTDSGTGTRKLQVEIRTGLSSAIYAAETELIKLQGKPNEVKCDRLTGGLSTGRLDFFPFGFYCYSPVHPSLPGEEAVRGFNMMSPYQKILPSTAGERKAYMDRCAALGMRVHYNLLSVSGGGGVGSEIAGLTWREKRELLVNEILTFRDHPALLAWYIADEPNGYNIEPDTLIEIYNTIKQLDAWHPVSMVFMAPFLSARRYSDALDIVMIDPYPVPDLPVSYAGNVARQVAEAFRGKKPVWLAAQAFGGGELWKREPTIQEIRAMTIQAMINGVSGIQYFVRQGPNIFPKSAGTWAECGKMAVETAFLTPWLLSDEKAPAVRCSSDNFIVRTGLHENQLMIMAANKSSSPLQCTFTIMTPVISKGKVLFENRSITASGGSFTDLFSSYGTQVYLFRLKQQSDSISAWPGNMIVDPGFEDTSSPGVPSACYAWGNGDRGATYFTDTREKVEGNQSVRLVTPQAGSGIRLRFFPVNVMKGRNYTISIWARSDFQQGFFELSLGGFGTTGFPLTGEWKQFVTNVTIPDSDEVSGRLNLTLRMPSAGVAWFDMVQVAGSCDIIRSVNPELTEFFK